MNQTTSEEERVKTEYLTDEEYAAYLEWLNTQITQRRAAKAIKVHYNTIGRVKDLKRGDPAIIEKIRSVIKVSTAA